MRDDFLNIYQEYSMCCVQGNEQSVGHLFVFNSECSEDICEESVSIWWHLGAKISSIQLLMSI